MVKNMRELERELKQRLRKAMQVTAKKVEADMYEEMGGFYTGGNPKIYERTGALGDTPRTSALTSSGLQMEFEAYLDTNHQYTTGKQPSMRAVLAVANDHGLASSYVLRPPVGNQHFWERAESRMEKTFHDTMRSFFEK